MSATPIVGDQQFKSVDIGESTSAKVTISSDGVNLKVGANNVLTEASTIMSFGVTGGSGGNAVTIGDATGGTADIKVTFPSGKYVLISESNTGTEGWEKMYYFDGTSTYLVKNYHWSLDSAALICKGELHTSGLNLRESTKPEHLMQSTMTPTPAAMIKKK